MDRTLRDVIDIASAEAAADHPCIHDFLYFAYADMYCCKICTFEMTRHQHEIFTALNFKESKDE
jgi:hypothetical protein